MFLAILFIYSCQNKPDVKYYSSKIDSLETSLEESAIAYEMIDVSNIEKELAIISEIIDNIHDEKAVVFYELAKNEFENYLKTRKSILKELNYTRSQIADLKYDIEKGLLNNEMAN